MDTKNLVARIEENSHNFKTHAKMFDILDGNLSEHLEDWLRGQLSGSSLRFALCRMAPINVLRKVIDKLSTIYQQAPRRFVTNGLPVDDQLLEYYEKSMKTNQKLNMANEFFNLSKATLIQPYVHMNGPRLRAVPNDRFFVYSEDEVDPLSPTHILTCHGDNWHVWSDEEFFVMSSRGTINTQEMARLGNPEGINPYGKIPYIYVNRSNNCLVPKPDRDSLLMTMLIPGLLTDLNFASMFSLFSIIYAIDVSNENLKMEPNAIWQFFSDSDSDKKPQIGTIKPEADITETLELVKSELAMWLQSRNIKPGTVGDVEGSSFASAVSKMVDEADTSDERKKQIEFFEQAEDDLWNLIKNHMHPYWVKTKQIPMILDWSSSSEVHVKFTENIPLANRGTLIRDLRDEVDAGFTSRKVAIATANPKLSEKEVEELMAEIDQEKLISVDFGGVDGTAEDQNQDPEGLQS